MQMTHALLWLNEAEIYRRALDCAGLGKNLDIQTLRFDQQPSAEQLARTEFMIARGVPPGTLARMPRLRWIQSLTAGVEGWTSLPDLRPDIALTCARGTHRVQMPENILGALFHLSKPYSQAVLDQRERRWVKRVSEPLAGKTLGILGLGEIGRELAKKAAALELRVIGTRRTPDPVQHVDQTYAPDDTDAVLSQSDFVLLLLPLTPETENFMNAQRFKRMRSSAYLLNFGRGATVVDADLVEAVQAKTIAGAVLDVFRKEPLPVEHPFWTTEGITVLPHIGGLAAHRDEIVAALFADNAQRFLAGDALRELVDRSRGY
jgi:phosphoglycerate dehydrogenase-like enzyme